VAAPVSSSRKNSMVLMPTIMGTSMNTFCAAHMDLSIVHFPAFSSTTRAEGSSGNKMGSCSDSPSSRVVEPASRSPPAPARALAAAPEPSEGALPGLRFSSVFLGASGDAGEVADPGLPLEAGAAEKARAS
jgi:hypothetical protein